MSTAGANLSGEPETSGGATGSNIADGPDRAGNPDGPGESRGVDPTRSTAAATGRTLSGFMAERSVPLTRFAYLLTGDHGRAEDLVQDAFLALYRRYGERVPLAAPVAYARKTIANAHISRSRRRASAEQPTDQIPDSPTPPPVDIAEQDAMWRALAGLPERQRTVLVCRYYLDLSDPDIGELLGCRRSTVRSLAARAFATLRTNPSLAEEQL